MGREYLRAVRVLVAGLLGVSMAVEARAEEPAAAAAPAPGQQALARLTALNVELAWLSHPATFPCPLQARPTAGGLEVCGFVPDLATKGVALRLVRAYSQYPILDGIALDPSLLGRPAAQDEASLRRAATEALHAGHAPADLEVRAEVGGCVRLFGSVRSVEEKRALSRLLLPVLGCTHVLNRMKVLPLERDGQVLLPISADGTLCIPYPARESLAGLPTGPSTWAEQRAPGSGPEARPASPSGAPGSGCLFAQDAGHPRAEPAAAANPNPLPGQLLPDIAAGSRDTALFASGRAGRTGSAEPSPWGGSAAGQGQFASFEPGSPALLPSLTDFAVPLKPTAETRAGSDFATAAPLPPQGLAAARSPDALPLPPVPGPAGGSVEASDRGPASGPKAVAPSPVVRVQAVQVRPLTADGQWPTAFVGGQTVQAIPPGSPPLPASPVAVVPPAPGPRLEGPPNQLRARLTGEVVSEGTAPKPLVLAQLEQQVAVLCGPAVRQLQFVQQDQKTILVVTVSGSLDQARVLSLLGQIPELEAAGVQVQLVVPR